MRFVHPWVLLLIPAVCGGLAWALFAFRGRRAALRYSDLGLLRPAGRRASGLPRSLLLPDGLLVLAAALFLTALARPQAGYRRTDVMTEGYDIMLGLDVSDSMRAEDFRPSNRLEVAKETIRRFVDARPHDRIGLVLFAAESVTRVPLTVDHAMLRDAVRKVDFGVIDGSRTAIGMGLAACVSRLRSSTAKSRIIILLTDGVNNAGFIDPMTAGRLAQAHGIRVYTVGVGSHGKVPFPVQHPLFGKRYQFVEAELDEETLRAVAALTGGRYYRATDTTALRSIYEEIDRLEKSVLRSEQPVRYEETYQAWLAAGLFAVLLSVTLSRLVWPVLP